jgi:flagellar motor switch protein FliG
VVAEQETPQLDGAKRAAALLLTLGSEVSAQVLARLREPEVERLTLEIATIGQLTPALRDELLAEARESIANSQIAATGGIDVASSMLEQAFGPLRAREMRQRVSDSVRRAPFAFTRDLEAGQLVSFLTGEHPQTVALILSYISASTAGTVLSLFPPGLQADVALRIARMERISPEVVREVAESMERKLSTALAPGAGLQRTGGPGALVNLLKSVDRSTERAVLEALDRLEPKLGEEVRKHMFIFDNIVQLDDRSIQRVLREVDNRDLALALKGVGNDVQQRILKNMSARAAAMMQDDMNAMGPVRLKNVEAAQTNIVNIIRALDEAEEIVLSRGEDEVLG